MYFDFAYLIFMLPAFLLSAWASYQTNATFKKYSRVRSFSGMTGASAARRLLSYSGISDVRIERVDGFLTDHYDPTAKVLRLSPAVYDSTSISAIGVACHEAGHAIQHATNYAFLTLRTMLVPIVQFSSVLSQWILLAGFVLMAFGARMGMNVVLFGVLLIAVAVVFSIVTLPVEWDASSRAKVHMVEFGIVSRDEAQSAGRVLNAAFMTYVAAAVSGIMTILYYLLRLGLLGRRDD